VWNNLSFEISDFNHYSRELMKAIVFDGALRMADDAAVPERAGEALVQVICAGICNTDLEIVKGYAGFRGIPGHEFVGRVVESPDGSMVGRRVVGEINVGCNACALCLAGDSRHCRARTVLGIKGRDGALAEFLSLPLRNLIEVPDSIPDESAVFVEPLAAACHVLDQVDISAASRVAVVGDGKLAQLITRVVAQTGCSLAVIGKHEEKLDLAAMAGARVFKVDAKAAIDDPYDLLRERIKRSEFDIVIDATGSPSGMAVSLRLVRPQGTLVLKSTHHAVTPVESSLVVVKELTIIGSRCGRFEPALSLLACGAVDVSPLITNRLPMREGLLAFKKASEPSSMKIILNNDCA
jgi:2-desacetyl-2-hydroxyethyl bacteriochlorophyllide A dehydrogenase